MGIMISMLKSQRRAFRWPNNFHARLYTVVYNTLQYAIHYTIYVCNVYLVHSTMYIK